MIQFKCENGEDASALVASELDYLKFFSVLQHYREAWVILPQYPYFYIDKDFVKSKLSSTGKFFFVTYGAIFQNIKRDDTLKRMIKGLVGGGVNNQKNQSGQFHEGMQNPHSWTFYPFNDPFFVGEMCFFSSGTQLIVVDEENVFQYRVGELNNTIDDMLTTIDYPFINDINVERQLMKEQALIRSKLSSYIFNDKKDLTDEEVIKLSTVMNECFSFNESILRKVITYHESNTEITPRYDHAPIHLGTYGDVVKSEGRDIVINYNLSLIHNDMCIKQINLLADSKEDSDLRVLHSSYFIISFATLVEVTLKSLAGDIGVSRPERIKAYKLCENIKAYTSIPEVKAILDKINSLYISYRKQRNFLMHNFEEELVIDHELGLPQNFAQRYGIETYKKDFTDLLDYFEQLFCLLGIESVLNTSKILKRFE